VPPFLCGFLLPIFFFPLSAYDAPYIELAMQNGAPLATLDTKLAKAAQKLGVKIF
jgi:predicted nucleic acid-binding protein